MALTNVLLGKKLMHDLRRRAKYEERMQMNVEPEGISLDGPNSVSDLGLNKTKE